MSTDKEDKISILFIQISFGSTKVIPVSGGDVPEIVRLRYVRENVFKVENITLRGMCNVSTLRSVVLV